MTEPEFTTRNITSDGILMLGQDQDSKGGDLDSEQSFSGKMGYFNTWDRILTEAEIVAMQTCQSERLGNVVAWGDSSWITRLVPSKITLRISPPAFKDFIFSNETQTLALNYSELCEENKNTCLLYTSPSPRD